MSTGFRAARTGWPDPERSLTAMRDRGFPALASSAMCSPIFNSTRCPADWPIGTVFMPTSTWFSAQDHKIGGRRVGCGYCPGRGGTAPNAGETRLMHATQGVLQKVRAMPAEPPASDLIENPVCTVALRISADSRVARKCSLSRLERNADPRAIQASLIRCKKRYFVPPDRIRQHARDPLQQRRLVAHQCALDGGLQSIGMTVAADRKCLAGHLQQANASEPIHDDDYSRRGK